MEVLHHGVFLGSKYNILGNVGLNKEEAKKNTIAYKILEAHNTGTDMGKLKIKFDAMASHDITYVGIIQTAKASGLEKFPLPYVLTNCHNTLCAVGGTINEDDHVFGLSAAKKYGGIFVPPNMAVIHSYMREMFAGCGKMILGSDSHTRYGAFGTMAIGEGGGELAKQLLNQTYDINYPEIICVRLSGKPAKNIGPHDVALSLIGKVFSSGFVKNKVLEFVGSGIQNLSMWFRSGIDVMTTETTCLSSIWETDEATKEYLETHNRGNSYKRLCLENTAYYDGLIDIDLSKIKPMIAMPFHPSNVYEIEYVIDNLREVLSKVSEDSLNFIHDPSLKLDLSGCIENGKLKVGQGIIAGCAGGSYESICAAADILGGHALGDDEFALTLYPESQPVYLQLVKNGVIESLASSGAIIKPAFCGPCFGAGDIPSNGTLSIRHTTRNFPNRDGSKPSENQMAGVALMDAKSIAATALNGGFLTCAGEYETKVRKYYFNSSVYKARCYNGYNNPNPGHALKYGPNISDWPEMPALTDNMLLKVVSYITDSVTTTDELIPSGETSSYRSNPLKLAEFTLSRKDPGYVPKAKAAQEIEKSRLNGENIEKFAPEFKGLDFSITSFGSAVAAVKPGDGSAREQAASCQKVLGTYANIVSEYATKRYRSNLINWGILPFTTESLSLIKLGDYIYIPGVRGAITNDSNKIKAYILSQNNLEIELSLNELSDKEREILLAGCLINYNKNKL
ncbi:MAG: hydratase [Clostridiales bacterium]|jgi:aconitate hydratase|nr:hydratase [Clostridiales bacterium]